MPTKPNARNAVASKRTTWIAGSLLGLLAIAHTLSLTIQFSEVAQADGDWRRTSQGWELAHALPASSSYDEQDVAFGVYLPKFPTLSTWQRVHRCLVPFSIAMFLATMCPWFVQALPNRALQR